MAKNKWATRLLKHEAAVDKELDIYENTLQLPSPSMNWTLANPGHGLPFGYGMQLGGTPKAGKSILALNIVAQMHKNDPEAIALMFNSELRGAAQANKKVLQKLGIDAERFFIYDTNKPDEIFDFIARDVNDMCQEGSPIKLIIIDSLSAIQGRRFMNADTVMTQQIGDHAVTIQDGLKMILPTIRRNRIAVIGCAHVRDEMDMQEQMRGNKYKVQGANAQKHFFEYFAFVERNRTKDGKVDAFGNQFLDEGVTDMMGKSDITAHKIRFKILDSSLGAPGRVGEFTLDFDQGIVNRYEEVANLGVNTGIVNRPNQVSYEFNGQKFAGWDNYVKAVRDSEDMQKEIMTRVYAKDSD